MKDVLFFAAFLVLPLIGMIVWRLEAVRRMDLAGRLAIAFAAGAVIVAAVMALMSVVGIAWSRTVLYAVFGVLAIVNVATGFSPSKGRAEARPHIALLLLAILAAYGLLTARMSAGDMQFFWAPKGIHFYRAGGISLEFLTDKINPNGDYPPLLPLLYAWGHLVAHQFSWWSALLTTALFIFGAALILRACSGDGDGAVLLAASLTWAVAVGFAAGGADPPLVFFETLTLAALTFLDDPRARNVLAALGLAGAVFTKIEGATFLIAVVLAVLLVQRAFRRAIVIAAPAAIVLGAWTYFIIKHKLIFGFGGGAMQIYWEAIPKALLALAKAASYELFWIPWIAPLALLALGRTRSRAALPLAVFVLSLGVAVFYYIHVPDPTWWIAASAPRVLLTPLTALIIAGVAAWRPHSI